MLLCKRHVFSKPTDCLPHFAAYDHLHIAQLQFGTNAEDPTSNTRSLSHCSAAALCNTTETPATQAQASISTAVNCCWPNSMPACR